MTSRSIVVLLLAVLSGQATAASEALFRAPLETFARVSPDGSALAVTVNDGNQQRIDRIDLATLERGTVLSTAMLNIGESTIAGTEWVDSDTLVVAVVELTDGVAKLSDTRHKRHLLVVDTSAGDAVVRYIETSGRLIDPLPSADNELLFARSGRVSIAYRVRTDHLHEWGKPLAKTARVDGGQFGRNNRVATVEGVAIRWITDAAGTVRAVLKWHPDDGLQLQMRATDDDDWYTERSWEEPTKKRRKKNSDDPEDEIIFRPEVLMAGGSEFVVFAKAEDTGRNAVYRYNYSTDEKTLIYQHPSAEIVDVGMSADNSHVTWVSYFQDGIIKYHYVRGAYRQVAAELEQRLPDYVIHIAATDSSEERYFLFAQSSTQPGRAYLFDSRTDQLTELFSVMPWIDESALVDSQAGRVMSHGLEIEYFLTVPRSTGKVPLLVYPHGGPWGVMDDRMFDPVVQYLAGRGLAVLQVNYRGSGGYGDQFLDEARGEFGNRMLDDIEAALEQALSNSAIDPDKVCTAGHSYGGYAALMLAIRSPDRYACVASMAGVTDLGLLLAGYPEDSVDALLPLFLRDSEDPVSQYEKLKSLSPLYNAAKLQAPLYLAHGTDDRRVDIEQGHRLRNYLALLGQPAKWLEIQDMGHSFDSPEAAFAYYESMADFVEEALTADN